VTRNLIHDVVDERTYSAIGIGLAAAGTGTGNVIANNMMYNLRGNGTAGDMTVGLCLSAGDGDKVVYNSMLLTGDLDPSGGPSSSSVSSAGIRIVSASVTNLTLKNNISNVDLTSNTSTLKHYAIIAPATSYAWGTGGANNNDYYVNASNTQMVLGGIGTTTPFTDVTTLAAWRTQFTPNQDGASVTGDPQYVSPTNLHIAGASVVANAGTAIPGVTTDFDGDARSGGTPDIGADEFTGGGTVVSVSILSGWNMLSNPVTTAADSVRQLYPTSSFAYAFSFAGAGGYQQQYRMLNTVGYWGKFPAATTANVSGNPRAFDSVAVSAGWNMVGSISTAIDTSNITSVPPGIRSSTAWFGYASGYSPSQFITPGYAYWVKVSAPGKFVFSAGPAPEKAATPRRSITGLNTLTLTDSRGGTQTLYFGVDADGALSGLDFEMPPAPPAGVLDARFVDGTRGLLVRTLAADAQGGEFPIAVQTDALPITVSWKLQAGEAGMAYQLSDGAGGSAFATIPMKGDGQATIARNGLSRLVIQAGNTGLIPKEFALLQNYPNPFNPSTTISFALPAPARVSLEVFNVLGQRIAVLVNNEERKAGFHAVEWNGTGADGLVVGSGVYFVRYSANGASGATFSDVRKMMLMK
jgi:hypothetical protein